VQQKISFREVTMHMHLYDAQAQLSIHLYQTAGREPCVTSAEAESRALNPNTLVRPTQASLSISRCLQSLAVCFLLRRARMVYLLSILIPFDSIRGHMTTCISCAEAEAVLLVFHDSDATLPVSFLFALFFLGCTQALFTSSL
jgi:hypothetical protein